MRILVTGTRSFAAQGLVELLAAAGHEVVTFNRGTASRHGSQVAGPTETMSENPHFDATYDAVVNYILLKDDNVEKNVTYTKVLLEFCKNKQVKHLLHISSISSFKSSVRRVHEKAKLEQVPERKGSYGSLKAATDLYLMKEAGPELKLTMLRPAFILGPGLVNPIVGTAARVPWNMLLVIGNGESGMPLISREQVNAAILKALENPPAESPDTLLLVASNTPTRNEYLQACCDDLGCGKGVAQWPRLLWWSVAIGGGAFATAIGLGKLGVYSKLTARLPTQRYDPAGTEKRLGMSLQLDWRKVLKESMDGQALNFDMPFKTAPLPTTHAKKISYLGYGRIVKQKHLPALKDLVFSGTLEAFDMVAGADSNGQVIKSIKTERVGDSDLIVVASPGTAHIQAIEQIGAAKGPVLIEKPLCYSDDELARWLAFGKQRQDPIYVCHNYRFKKNVRAAIDTLSKWNPGQLNHVSIHFESPPVSASSSPWMRNERVSRTLLLDFSLHFLDLACMFGRGVWKTDHVRYTLNSAGQTAMIDGHIACDTYGISFLLRQGFGPRRARVLLNFQNYSVSLGFFPDTYVTYMSNDNPWLHKYEKKQSMKATVRKILDKLTSKESDDSHPIAIAAAMGTAPTYEKCIRMETLAPFYTGMFELSRHIYGI